MSTSDGAVTRINLARDPEDAAAIANAVIQGLAEGLLERLDALNTPDGFVRRKGAAAVLGVSPMTFERLRQNHEDFPRPRRLTKQVIAWSRRELMVWGLSQPIVEPQRQRRMEV